MAYRNGTYIAFHAEGTAVPADSDMKYYSLLKAWTENSSICFSFINSHDKASSVRDTSKRATLKASLQERLRNSRNMLLIIGETTRLDTDWVPFEIQQAVDKYAIPIIAAYPGCDCILAPRELGGLWPGALAKRIQARTARVIHVPFKKAPITAAIRQFDYDAPPSGSLTYYSRDSYVKWGLIR